jgi:hypothetical protein
MKIKQVLILVVAIAISFGVFIACDHQPSTINQHLSAEALAQEESPTNLVPNPSFEEGKVFNSGLYGEGNSPLGKPTGWSTHNQLLNDSTGWVTDEAHTGKRSLKIVNISGTDAYWKSDPIVFKEPANAFEASIWAMSKDVKSNEGKCQLAFDVLLKEYGTIRVFTNIPTNKTGWQLISQKFTFASDISKIVPYCILSGTVGTAWFDDLSLSPIKTEWSNTKEVLFENLVTTDKNKNIYELKGDQRLYSSDFLPIEQHFAYALAGKFKAVGAEPSFVYFGIDCYNKDKQSIRTHFFNYIKGTETEVLRACTATDKFIIVKDASNWKPDPNGCIAFNIDDSGEYSDLPNFDVSSFGIDKVKKFGQFWKIYLSKKIGSNFSAGTKIREHKSTGGYIYCATPGHKIPNKWTEYKGTVYGEESAPSVNSVIFYPKTKYIKILILGNYKQTSKSVLQFKNIKFKQIFTQG